MNRLKVNPKLLGSAIAASAGDHLSDFKKDLEGDSQVSWTEVFEHELFSQLIAIYYSLCSILVSRHLKDSEFTKFDSLIMEELFLRLKSHSEYQQYEMNVKKFDKYLNQVVSLIIRDEKTPQIVKALEKYEKITSFKADDYFLEYYFKVQYLTNLSFKCVDIQDILFFTRLWFVNSTALNAFFEEFKNIEPTLEELDD